MTKTSRIPDIATRTGDAGETSLWCGTRVSKADPRVATVGLIDKALSAMGLCHHYLDAVTAAKLLEIQRRFVALMGEVACSDDKKDAYFAKREAITEADLESVEGLYASLKHGLEASGRQLGRWQLYGQFGPAAAACYFARACFREAELALWRLDEHGHPQRDLIMKIMNRMSDVLFFMALSLEEAVSPA